MLWILAHEFHEPNLNKLLRLGAANFAFLVSGYTWYCGKVNPKKGKNWRP
jgi:hypothetical protein